KTADTGEKSLNSVNPASTGSTLYGPTRSYAFRDRAVRKTSANAGTPSQRTDGARRVRLVVKSRQAQERKVKWQQQLSTAVRAASVRPFSAASPHGVRVSISLGAIPT